MKKKIGIICYIMIIVILFCACRSPRAYCWRPDSQPNTKWSSKDGTITFFVNENGWEFGDTRGTLAFEDQTIDFIVDFAYETPMLLCPTDMLENSDSGYSYYERWECSYRSKKYFVATVKETTFFVVGQEIEFCRVDE